jgi:hypothetical protein
VANKGYGRHLDLDVCHCQISCMDVATGSHRWLDWVFLLLKYTAWVFVSNLLHGSRFLCTASCISVSCWGLQPLSAFYVTESNGCRHNFALQVSNAGVAALARLAAGRTSEAGKSGGNDNGNGSQAGIAQDQLLLSIADFRTVPDAAHQAVDVPEPVVDLLAELRNWLADKAEPPVRVSDRRLMKAVRLLQVGTA